MNSRNYFFNNIRLIVITVILIPLTSIRIYSQTWEIVYDSIHSLGRDVSLTNDSCYIITSTNNPCDPGFCLKINRFGNIIWFSPYGGYEVKQTFDNGYIIGGSNSSLDGELKKLDGQGYFLWSESYGGSGQDEFYSVIQSSDSCYVACGFSNSHSDSNFYIVKADQEGNLLWEKNFYCYESGYLSEVIEMNNYYYAVGPEYDSTQSPYLLLIKLNPAGSLIWRKDFQIGNTGLAIAQTSDSSIIVAGGCLLTKFDLNGDTIWSRSYYPNWITYSVDITSDNGYILSGKQRYNGWDEVNLLVKTDSSGNIQWFKTYSNGFTTMINNFESVKSTADSGFITCGYSMYNNNILKLRILKTNSNGELINIPEYIKGFDLEVYPNPTSGKIIIENIAFNYIEVFNSMGNLLFRSMTGKIDISDQPDGIYYVKIVTDKGIAIKKIIKI